MKVDSHLDLGVAEIPASPAAIYHFLMDAAGDPQAMQSCRVQSEGVKNESKGLQETGLPAIIWG